MAGRDVFLHYQYQSNARSAGPPLTGTVAVSGLEIFCIIGIRPDERLTPQTVVVDFEIDYDIGPASESGDITLAVDYAAAARAAALFIEQSQFALLETLVTKTIDHLKSQVDAGENANGNVRVTRIRLTASKPNALGGNGLPSVTVETRYPI